MTAKEALKNYFGYDSFREGQENIIESIMAGRDSLAIMPTGAGKSVCYQVPALLLSGITIVISPLISLMQDQVKALNEAGIHAAFINSSLTEAQVSKALKLAAAGRYKLIYVAPERLESFDFMEFVNQVDISMVTVDEAHCISQWGQDFRPSYLKIVDFIKNFPQRPIVSAFTATATEEVKNDILCILNLREPKVTVTGFDRKNLYYSVESVRKKEDFVIDYIEKHSEDSGIIYCATRKNVDKLFEALWKRGVPVTEYHAGMENEIRKKNQDDFIYDRSSVIIATNAFGMGIDKSNVRYVIHYNMPQSMENYYQEAGRAGRDGEPAQCVLLFSPQDVMIQRFLLERKDFSGLDDEDAELVRQRDMYRLTTMERYCRTTGCLRNYILLYFGEKVSEPCDNCGNCHRIYKETDMTVEAKQVINCVAETRGRYGLVIVLGTLMGANRARLKELGTDKYKSYGALKNYTEAQIRTLIGQMIGEGYLYQTQEQYSVLKIGDIEPLKDENTRVIVRTYEEKEAERKKKAPGRRSTDSLTSAGYDLFESLRKLRMEIAREESLPPYIIFNDKTLIEMCEKLPVTEKDMLKVSGVGQNKLEKYGGRFMGVIEAFLMMHPGAVVSISDEPTELEESVIGKYRESSGRNGSSKSFDRAEFNRLRNRPEGAGASWSEEEDARLEQEYQSGMRISEIARLHNRTRGGIHARLKKHGLVE
ncbi:MAG: DNA helicase RecQ [Bacteroidales bacterium]|nr:DNA helicase RecQ [Lachnoclostridium sp.]MCM1385489.1 DNA helicase RecQ [Lachnoclostridium sp.]MCM1466213.1 DNA helicase RecQ [Bacteroidales bacterium]